MKRKLNGNSPVLVPNKKPSENIKNPVDRILELENLARGDIKNINCIIEIRELVEGNPYWDTVVKRGGNILLQLFVYYDEQFPFLFDRDTDQKTEAQLELIKWLKNQLDKFTDVMLLLLHSRYPSIQEECMDILLKLMYARSERTLSECSIGILRGLIFNLCVNRQLEGRVRDIPLDEVFTRYDDVRYWALVKLKELMVSELDHLCKDLPKRLLKLEGTNFQPMSVKSIRDKALRNILFYLEAFKIPDAKTQEVANFVQLSSKDKRPEKALKPPAKLRKNQRGALSAAWRGFLVIENLPTKLYLDVLIKVPEVIIPAMNNPLILADFLTDSYNFGGELAVTSLYGLYTLMRDHGLDYPEFYPRLYTMLKPNIFKSRRKAMFLKLIRLFLSSKFLPESLMAAFAKRLSRLALTASPEGAIFCIETALCRRDSIQHLIHRKLSRLDETLNLDKIRKIDPFLEDCDDPESCQAQDSSLWEIKSLQNHYLPEISKAAKKINKPRRKDLPKQEASTATIRSIATALLTTKRHRTPLEYTRRKKLFDKLNGDNIFNEAFVLCA